MTTRFWVALLAVAAITALAAVVMVVTGYVPTDGFGHSASHAARFGITYGICAGSLIGVAFWIWTI